MTGLTRTRDCLVVYKGDAYPVTIDSEMAESGWAGGQGVMWQDSTEDEFLVTFSDGLYGGFLLWGSDEESDQFTSLSGNQPRYRFGTLCTGGWLIATTTYERYTYDSRVAGPLVPLTYTEGERLVFSLRGYFTKEDEWTLSGDPRGSNGYYVASVVQAPSAQNDYYITLQTSI